MQGTKRSLPDPQRERWQPLRSGFVNLYRYDREEFHYENGRLLLRGNNGTGKSRVLALQLPFLLDGEVIPQRLEPDADPSKKIEWNLLMGRYPDRTGYTWIEFGRRDSNGENHYLTLGCGLSAVEGQSGVRKWFFVTAQRIGLDLALVNDANQVLGKDRLRDKIGSAGQVFDAAGAYRRAVNEALFHLDEYRYGSLMNLLIQLRRPQLTRRLDEEELSGALGEALPPVAPVIIRNLAEAFRDLESDRGKLESYKVAHVAVDRFLASYRSYAEVVAKRRADRVIAAHREYEAGMKEILLSEAECDQSLTELAKLKTELQRLSVEQHTLQTEITALEQNPHVKDSTAVEQARREAKEKREDAASAAAELANTVQGRKTRSEEHIRLMAALDQRKVQLAAVIDAAAVAASAAGLENIHNEVCGAVDAQTANELALQPARETIESAIQTQMEKIGHARKLNSRIVLARNDFQQAVARNNQLCGLLDDALERLNAARREHRSSITSFLDAASDWTANLRELPLPFDDAFLRTVTAWCDNPRGPNPFEAASRKAVEDGIRNFAERRALLAELETVGEALDDIDSRERRLRSEAKAAPVDDRVRGANEQAIAIAQVIEGLRLRMAEAEQQVNLKRSQLDEVNQQADEALRDLRIVSSIELDELDSLRDGLGNYRLAISRLWSTVESLLEARHACERAWTHVEEAAVRQARQADFADRMERRAREAEIAYDTARQGIDADSEDILQRVAEARRRLEDIRIEEREALRRYHDTELGATRLDERLRNRAAILNRETDRRDSAASALQACASSGLLNLAVSGIASEDAQTWSATRIVEIAFHVGGRLNHIEAGDSAWEHHQKSIPAQFNALMETLSVQGFQSSAVFRDDLFVATILWAGRERTTPEVHATLSDEVATRQMLLNAREKEILENHLVGSVSNHLRELLHGAEEQVRQMNAELESRPMSTGMKLRFVWRPAENAPSGMAEVRGRLMESNSAWSSAEKEMLGSFLQQQILAVCSDTGGVSWQESLAEALDYRKWHRFGIERYQDGAWKRLTRRTHGTGSGGEKAVALTLPHFAAAAAFYRSASPHAPRLILLDEAFVGIDSDMRGKCMGLIHTFDLDFMMTSEREWGCYPTLPGIAIYHLSTRPGIDAIGLTRWVWNGRARSLVETGATPTEHGPDLVEVG
jgi:SbcC/RAD50-like, Walker B motif